MTYHSEYHKNMLHSARTAHKRYKYLLLECIKRHFLFSHWNIKQHFRSKQNCTLDDVAGAFVVAVCFFFCASSFLGFGYMQLFSCYFVCCCDEWLWTMLNCIFCVCGEREREMIHLMSPINVVWTVCERAQWRCTHYIVCLWIAQAKWILNRIWFTMQWTMSIKPDVLCVASTRSSWLLSAV